MNNVNQEKLNELIQQATQGDKTALDTIIEQVKTPVYNLALRMLRDPQDAEDMTQEILIKIITHLGSFRGESAFMTWVYRLTTNHLLNEQRKPTQTTLDFDTLSDRLQFSLTLYEQSPSELVEDRLLTEEVKRHCTLGMLQCLDQHQRMVLILGELFHVSSEEGSIILDISPAAFRKRLSRARAQIVAFVSRQCGIVNPANPCRCHKHVQNKIMAGALDSSRLLYARQSEAASEQEALLAEQATLAKHRRAGALLWAHPVYQASDAYSQAIKEMLV